VQWLEEITGCEQRNKFDCSPRTPPCNCVSLPPVRYKVMAKPLNFDIKNQDQVVNSLPPFFNMKEHSEVLLLPPPPSRNLQHVMPRRPASAFSARRRRS
jgi:hypothetical protein